MMTKSTHPDSTTPSLRLAVLEESLIQITLKLKNIVFDVCL